MANKSRNKIVHVLMFDSNGSKESGSPEGVFHKLPRMEELLNWGRS